MSRMGDVLNRIELIAYKMKMSIEEMVEILEGRHPTHVVVRKSEPADPASNIENPTVSAATSNSTKAADTTNATASAPTAGTKSPSNAVKAAQAAVGRILHPNNAASGNEIAAANQAAAKSTVEA